MLADASNHPGGGEAKSAKCAEFERDHNADAGDIILASCKPTTAQMDNPLGNLAMLFTQFDFTRFVPSWFPPISAFL